MTLDWLLQSLPLRRSSRSTLKGAEMEVLEGATRLFETVRPVVLCEVIPASERAVTTFLQSYDYQIFDGETKASDREALRTAPWSTLAIPA